MTDSVAPRQPSLVDFDCETVLPLDLVKTHCKIDDLPGITDLQLDLYRRAAFEAAELYTGKKWIKRVKITQDIASPRFRGLAQAAVARVPVYLDYMPLDGVVNVAGTGELLFWMSGIPLTNFREPQYQTIVLPPGIQQFEMRNNIMFFESGALESCREHNSFVQQGATASYIAGPKTASDIPAGILLGCLKYIAWSIENPGDQFVPMVVRQVGVTTVSNDPAFSSGAIDEWRRHRRNIAR